jgi:hypothetical protein
LRTVDASQSVPDVMRIISEIVTAAI